MGWLKAISTGIAWLWSRITKGSDATIIAYFERIIQGLTGRLDDCESKHTKCEERADALASQVTSLSDRLAFLEQAGMIVQVFCDSKGVITDCGTVIHSMLGYTREELIGKPLMRLVPFQKRTSHSLQFARVVAGEIALRSTPMDVTALHKAGHEIDVTIRLSSWKNEQRGEMEYAAEVRYRQLGQGHGA